MPGRWGSRGRCSRRWRCFCDKGRAQGEGPDPQQSEGRQQQVPGALAPLRHGAVPGKARELPIPRQLRAQGRHADVLARGRGPAQHDGHRRDRQGIDARYGQRPQGRGGDRLRRARRRHGVPGRRRGRDHGGLRVRRREDCAHGPHGEDPHSPEDRHIDGGRDHPGRGHAQIPPHVRGPRHRHMGVPGGDRARGEGGDRTRKRNPQHEDEGLLRRLHAPRAGRGPGAAEPEGGA